MTTFKDIAKRDVGRTFLNLNEFAEKHMVDGAEMTVIIDNNEMLEREKRYKELEEGTYKKQILFYVSAQEFGALPRIGRLMKFDGRDYLVADAIREGAIYSVSLEANKS